MGHDFGAYDVRQDSFDRTELLQWTTVTLYPTLRLVVTDVSISLDEIIDANVQDNLPSATVTQNAGDEVLVSKRQ